MYAALTNKKQDYFYQRHADNIAKWSGFRFAFTVPQEICKQILKVEHLRNAKPVATLTLDVDLPMHHKYIRVHLVTQSF
jgi:hypothetical protein